ncbi:3-keto-disaccharide hydrolase [Gimesia sp.]|uniref:3-keto-disaccharide hydrolase n=1 Tax=Gimesia sp. TaxID=2024833 RepID=UPI003A908ACE
MNILNYFGTPVYQCFLPKTCLLLVLTFSWLTAQTVSADTPPEKEDARQTNAPQETGKQPEHKWISLFNGKNLDGWKVPQFGGEGEVHVEKGNLILEMGVDLTGATLVDTKNLPLTNYEVELEAMRVDGTDFFCGLTFPVKKDPCSLIMGGWGGSLCGISSIDGDDASQNSTTTFQTFKKNQWYKIRLQVTDHKIQVWLDGKQIVDQNLKDRKISIRHEVELSRPFGITSFCTTAALKNIRLRKLTPEEVAKTAPQK